MFAKAGTVFKTYSALDLAVHSVDGLLEKQELDPGSVNELVYGIVIVEPRIPQFAREVVFSSRLPEHVYALSRSQLSCLPPGLGHRYSRQLAPVRTGCRYRTRISLGPVSAMALRRRVSG